MLLDSLDHFSGGLIQPDKDRARDDIVTDIKLRYLGNRGERADVAVGQTVSGGDDQAQILAFSGGAIDSFDFLRGAHRAFAVRRSGA